jgi:hypothetical protein
MERRPVGDACTVRLECLECALAHDDLTGVWAGTSRQQRDRARRRGLGAEWLLARVDARAS